MIQGQRLEYLAFGIDSSNHGKDPEYFVAVASTNREDTRVIPNHPKIKDPFQLSSFLNDRDYLYTVVNEQDILKLGNQGVAVRATTDLICAFPYTSAFLDIYFDGSLMSREREQIRDALSDRLNLNPQFIQVAEVPKRKMNATNLLISLADGKASNLFRGRDPQCPEKRIFFSR